MGFRREQSDNIADIFLCRKLNNILLYIGLICNDLFIIYKVYNLFLLV